MPSTKAATLEQPVAASLSNRISRDHIDGILERSILALVLSILVFGPLATGAVRASEFLVIQTFTLAIVLLWSVRVWLRTGYRLLWPPVCWPALLFVAYAIFSYSQAELEYVARDELIKVLVYGTLFFAIIDNLNRQDWTQIIVFTLVFLAMLISIYAVYQFITGTDRVWHFIKPPAYKGRATGTYICPNHLAGFLELLLPLALAHTLMGRMNHVLKVLLGYAAFVMLAGIGVTISRAAWVCVGLSLVFFFAILFRKRDYRIPAIIFFVALAAMGVAFGVKSLVTKQRFQMLIKADSSMRIHLTKPALEIWKEHPWIGAGPAHYDYLFPKHRPKEVQSRPLWAHNDYANTLADYGLIGLAIIIAAVGLTFWSGSRIWKFVQHSSDFASKPSNRSALVLGSAAGLMALCFHSLVDFNMHIPANAITAITLMALLTGHFRFATERFWYNPGLIGKILATILLLGLFGYLGQQGIRRGNEYFSMLQAEANPRYSLARADALALAQKHEPTNFERAYEIGETYRLLAWDGNPPRAQLMFEAQSWLEQAMKLNPHDPYAVLRLGMIADWSKQYKEGAKYFARTLLLDPNNYYIIAHYGWHLMQIDDYAGAIQAFEKSIALSSWQHWNQISHTYLPIAKKRLEQQQAQ